MDPLNTATETHHSLSYGHEQSRIHGHGAMCDRIRRYEWANTVLGPIASWPPELVVMVNQLLSSKLIACIIWGPTKTLLYNDLYQPLLGNKPLALGESFLDVWEEIREQASAIISAPLDLGEANIFEKVPFRILLDGEFVEKICSLTNNPIWVETPEGTRILGLYQTIVDHTEGEMAIRQLRVSEASLQQSYADLAAMYESGAVAAALIDAKEFRYIQVNAKLAEMLDTSKAELTGRSVFDLASDVPLFRTQLEQVAGGTPLMNVVVEGEISNRPGERRTFQSNYVPVRSPGTGEVVRIAAACIEITAQKKVEAILIRNEKLAAVGRLAASIAHEINNPLESVTNLLYLARGEHDVTAMHGYLDTAERELRRASATTSQTLRFYRQSTHAVGITSHELYESVLALQQGRIVNSRIQLEFRERTQEVIKCFDGEIRQVLNNIIGNAIDAMLATGGRLLMRSCTGTDWVTGAKGTVLTIADDGGGIPREVQTRLFEAFHTTKGINGNGLGLWISKEIIERHAGSLKVSSSTNPDHSGTVLRIFLPFDWISR
jgi:PAS domain S-box-containing protein